MPIRVMPLLLVVLLLRLLLARCCHSVAATVLVAGGQTAQSRDKRVYHFRERVVPWVVHKLAE